MGTEREAWDDVDQRVSELGQRLRQHFGGSGDDERGAAMREAVRALTAALDRVGASISAAANDPEVRDAARDATTALGRAVGATLDELGRQIDALAKRRGETTAPSGAGSGDTRPPPPDQAALGHPAP
ncbi:MAG: hypothetical protein MUF83_03320 [Acidimicrobiales bacterium]|jgi:hypothetical protein|nr:hypothetical protein [Acidimicrobiales bacterium]